MDYAPSMSSPRPGVASIDTTFHHIDDISWTPVQRQRNADGTESAVREQWPVMHPRCLSATCTTIRVWWCAATATVASMS